MEKMKLKKLIYLVRKNDEDAFQELYRRYHRLVFYVAYQVTKNHADAEEVVQETFVQVTRSIDSLKDPEQFKSWVGRIAYTKAITMLRKNRDQQLSDQQLEMLSNKTELRWDYCPDEKSHHDADMRVLHECMAKLKLPYREVLTLYYFAQLNIKEIADLTQYPEGTVKSRLLYGKKYLREEIELYEQQNQIKLDFHATSLEAVLEGYDSDVAKEQMQSLYDAVNTQKEAASKIEKLKEYSSEMMSYEDMVNDTVKFLGELRKHLRDGKFTESGYKELLYNYNHVIDDYNRFVN